MGSSKEDDYGYCSECDESTMYLAKYLNGPEEIKGSRFLCCGRCGRTLHADILAMLPTIIDCEE